MNTAIYIECFQQQQQQQQIVKFISKSTQKQKQAKFSVYCFLWIFRNSITVLLLQLLQQITQSAKSVRNTEHPAIIHKRTRFVLIFFISFESSQNCGIFTHITINTVDAVLKVSPKAYRISQLKLSVARPHRLPSWLTGRKRNQTAYKLFEFMAKSATYITLRSLLTIDVATHPNPINYTHALTSGPTLTQ